MKKGYSLIFLTAIISGFSIFINRFGVKAMNPYVFTWLKNSVVVIFLTGLLLALRLIPKLKKLNKRQWFLLIIIGLTGGSIPFLLFFKGLSLTSAVMGSFWHKTMFLYVAVLAAIFLKEKINKKFFLGSAVLLLGNFLFLKGLSFSTGWGDVLVLSAALFWAVENIISKYALKELSAKTVAWGRMFFGSLFIFIFLLFTGQARLLSGISFSQISWVIVTSIILFGYVLTWYEGLKHVPVSKATVILLLGSPITTLLSFIWTKQLNLQGILASFLVVFGIVLTFGAKEIWQLVRKTKKNDLCRDLN